MRMTARLFYMQYSLPALSPADLIERWRAQGLYIPDPSYAQHQIKTVGYHRLNRYARFLRDQQGNFRTGITYEYLWAIYVFDRRLRLLSLDAIERIEVAVRTVMSDSLSQRHGPHWFMDAQLFKTASYAATFQGVIADEIRKNNPQYQSYEVSLYYKNYKSPPLPPSWIVIEHLSMGEWCKALPMLVRIEQKIIGLEFGLPANLMTSWISSLALLRNVCAHHGMIWHRRNTRRPELQKNPPRFCPDFSADSGNYYASACIMQYFLKSIAPSSSWSSRLKALFDESSPQFAQDLGFPRHWEQDSFWGIS